MMKNFTALGCFLLAVCFTSCGGKNGSQQAEDEISKKPFIPVPTYVCRDVLRKNYSLAKVSISGADYPRTAPFSLRQYTRNVKKTLVPRIFSYMSSHLGQSYCEADGVYPDVANCKLYIANYSNDVRFLELVFRNSNDSKLQNFAAKIRESEEQIQNPVPISPVNESCGEAIAGIYGGSVGIRKFFNNELPRNELSHYLDITRYYEPARVTGYTGGQYISFLPVDFVSSIETAVSNNLENFTKGLDPEIHEIRAFDHWIGELGIDPIKEILENFEEDREQALIRSGELRLDHFTFKIYAYIAGLKHLKNNDFHGLETGRELIDTRVDNVLKVVEEKFDQAHSYTEKYGAFGDWQEESPFENRWRNQFSKVSQELQSCGYQIGKFGSNLDVGTNCAVDKFKQAKIDSLLTSYLFLELAGIADSELDAESAEKFLNISDETFETALAIGKGLVDVAISLSPAGRAKDIIEAVSGRSIIPNFEEQSTLERVLGAIGAVTVGGGTLKIIAKYAVKSKIFSVTKNTVGVIFRSGNEIVESAGKLGLSKVDDIRDLTNIAKASAGKNTDLITKNIDDYAEAARLGAGPKILAGHAMNFKNIKHYNRKLSQPEYFNRYHGVNNRTGKKIVYTTKIDYVDEESLRDGAAILEEWGVSITKKTKFEAPAGTWVTEGLSASQKGRKGEIRPGGDYQALFSIPDIPKSWIKSTMEAFK